MCKVVKYFAKEDKETGSAACFLYISTIDTNRVTELSLDLDFLFEQRKIKGVRLFVSLNTFGCTLEEL